MRNATIRSWAIAMLAFATAAGLAARAIAIVAGKASSDALLEFRDLFYEIRDRYPRRIGDPAAIKQGRKDAMGRGLDSRERQEVRSTVLRLRELADEIERTCANANLVAEVKERSGVGDPYLELLDKPVNPEPLNPVSPYAMAPPACSLNSTSVAVFGSGSSGISGTK